MLNYNTLVGDYQPINETDIGWKICKVHPETGELYPMLSSIKYDIKRTFIHWDDSFVENPHDKGKSGFCFFNSLFEAEFCLWNICEFSEWCDIRIPACLITKPFSEIENHFAGINFQYKIFEIEYKMGMGKNFQVPLHQGYKMKEVCLAKMFKVKV